MNALDAKLAKLQADVTAEKTVEDSAIALIKGFPALLKTAVDVALASGATPTQLQAFDDLSVSIEGNAASLGAAVTANTPAPAGP